MKTAVLVFAFFCVCIGELAAQVTMEITMDQDQFLPGETLNAVVRITNLSGQTLNLGTEEDWLRFSAESRDGFIVLKTGEAPVAEKIVLDSAKAAIKRVNIAPYFNLKKPGHYTLTATARITDWNKQITSAPKEFDIINAATLRDKEFGLPPPPGMSGRPPEVRKYTLLQANYLQKLTLYFQLSDASGKIMKVYPLGPMLNISLPEIQVDRLSNLHVLYQIGAHAACYTVFNPDGEITKRQTYDFEARPRLRFDDEGNVVVSGATRRVKPDDLPPADLAASQEKTSDPK